MDRDGGHPDGSRQQSHAVGHREYLNTGTGTPAQAKRVMSEKFFRVAELAQSYLAEPSTAGAPSPFYSVPVLGPTLAERLSSPVGVGLGLDLPKRLVGLVQFLNTGTTPRHRQSAAIRNFLLL